MEQQLEDGFEAANSTNSPRADVLMLGRFLSSHKRSLSYERFCDDELSQASYGQEAVTYVQLKRDGALCTLKCIIHPDDAENSRIFPVTLIVNEEDKTVTSLECHGCKSTNWTCKHELAFLLWVHRTSEQPTRETCYLSKTRDPSRKGIKRDHVDQEEQTQNSVRSAVMTQLICKYDTKHNCDEFLKDVTVTDSLIIKIEEETREQSQNPLWHELRKGRITTSIAHDISDYKNFVDKSNMIGTIMKSGGSDDDNLAMKSGRDLKDSVREKVCMELNKNFEKCGLFISKECPIIAGSPDGICEDSIISIKCPISSSSVKYYIKYGQPTDKCNTQMQMLMYVTGKKKCYLCIANYDYEVSKKVKIVPVSYDESYVADVVEALVDFWKMNVYDLLCS